MAQIEPKSGLDNWHGLNRNRWHNYTETGGTNRTVISIDRPYGSRPLGESPVIEGKFKLDRSVLVKAGGMPVVSLRFSHKKGRK